MANTGKNQGAAGGRPAADDPHYNLISILYHALKGADLYDEYVSDAEASGDTELRDFFVEVRDEETHRAARARELLRSRFESQSAGQTDIESAAE